MDKKIVQMEISCKNIIQVEISCLKRVRENLAKYNAGEKAIAIVDGMIDGNEHTIKCLDAEEEWLKAAAYGTGKIYEQQTKGE